MNTNFAATHWMVLRLGITLIALFSAFLVQSAHAQNDVCFPQIGSVTGLPTIEGLVEDDHRWSGAGLRNLNASGGATRTAYFFAGRSSADLYLAFAVEVPAAHYDDTIVVVFSAAPSATDSAAANDWRIHIKPWDTTTVTGSNLTPHKIYYWRDSRNWNDPSAVRNEAGAGHWLKNNTRYSFNGSRWFVEMRIPRHTNASNASLDTSVYLPASGNWRFYANVLSPFDPATSRFTQAPWPESAEIVAPVAGLATISRLTPPFASWAVASMNTSICQGVSLAWNQIGAKVPPSPTESSILRKRYGSPTESLPANCSALDDTVSAGPRNAFFARPGNNGANAPGVYATFWIANWGISSRADFTRITGPVLGPTHITNPTPTQTVTTGGGQEFNLEWSLTDRESCIRAKTHGGHFCMLAELDSVATGVRFVNRSVVRNMDFVPASTFSREAVISSRKIPLPEGMNAHELLLTVDTERQLYTQDGPFLYAQKPRGGLSGDLRKIPAGAYPKPVREGLIWIARGYYPTGNRIIIDEDRGTAYEYARLAGGFGYVVGHEAVGATWRQEIKGQGVKAISERQTRDGRESSQLYQVPVPKEAHAVLDTRISAGEEKPTGDGRKDGICNTLKLGAAPAVLAAILGVVVFPRRRSKKEGESGDQT